MLSRGEDIVPIPGTKRRRWLEENIRALDLALDDGDLARLEAIFTPGVVAGTRYAAGQMKRLGL